ncbi:MAG: carbohydrate ABC transporter permease [Eubacteriales bacterium]|nr:carbohydrate ABC transporter permease [Eubacteriales bacterium]
MTKQNKKRLGTLLYISGLAALFLGLVFLLAKNSGLYPMLLITSALLIASGLYLNHSYQTKLGTFKLFQHVLLILGAVVMVFPFYWMIASAFKTSAEMNIFPPTMLPNNWFNYDNFVIAFKTAPFARYFINSVITCLSSVAITTLTTILASFAFSRFNFPGKEIIFSLLLSMMMVPFEILVITNYTTIVKLSINDTLWALVLPFTSSIFYTYILRNFFQSIPDGLYWSARVDGCSNWRYLWKVMVPIAKPSLSTIVLLNAMASWNSFMWPMLVIKQDTNRTLPFGLYTFTTEVGANNELLMAASSVVVLPMIILFLFARKQIVGGVARGGIKG